MHVCLFAVVQIDSPDGNSLKILDFVFFMNLFIQELKLKACKMLYFSTNTSNMNLTWQGVALNVYCGQVKGSIESSNKCLINIV